MKIGWEYWGGPSFDGHFGLVSVKLQSDHVKEITFEGNKANIEFSDGYALPDWMPTEKTIGVQSQMGHYRASGKKANSYQ